MRREWMLTYELLEFDYFLPGKHCLRQLSFDELLPEANGCRLKWSLSRKRKAVLNPLYVWPPHCSCCIRLLVHRRRSQTEVYYGHKFYDPRYTCQRWPAILLNKRSFSLTHVPVNFVKNHSQGGSRGACHYLFVMRLFFIGTPLLVIKRNDCNQWSSRKHGRHGIGEKVDKDASNPSVNCLKEWLFDFHKCMESASPRNHSTKPNIKYFFFFGVPLLFYVYNEYKREPQCSDNSISTAVFCVAFISMQPAWSYGVHSRGKALIL